jgi:rod shape-determining protein MreC
MNRLFKKYENIILLLSLLIFSAVLLSNNARGRKHTAILERIVLAVVTPFQDAITTGIRDVVLGWNHYFYLVGTSKENATLRKMLSEQVFKNNLLREELKKYRRVEALISHSPELALKNGVIADVVAWDASGAAKTIAVDRGEKDGVKTGMVVLNHFGLVGRVVATAARDSRVLLITDARSAVDAYVQRTRARAVVVGRNSAVCDVKYLSVKDDVKEGDVLISSGLGGIFPAGLQLGRITLLETGASKLFSKAEMLPSTNLDHLEEIIVTEFQPPDYKPEPAQERLENEP